MLRDEQLSLLNPGGSLIKCTLCTEANSNLIETTWHNVTLFSVRIRVRLKNYVTFIEEHFLKKMNVEKFPLRVWF